MSGSKRDYDERDDLQVFETGDDQDSEGSSLLMAIVISLLVLAALGCVVWIAYNNGVAHGHRDVAMQAMSAAKDTPLATGDASLPKNQVKAEGEGDGAPAPAAQPAPVQAAAAAPAPITQSQQVANAPAAKAVPQATKPPAQLMPPRPLSQVTAPAAPASAPPAAKAPARLQPPALPAAKVPAQKPVAAKPVEAKPEAKSVAAPKAAAKPAEKSAEKAAVAEKPVAKTAVKAGSYMLQLGAYKTEAEADTAWKSYKAKHAAALGGAAPDIQKADLGDKGTWYRLRTGPFASKDAAGAQCDKLKADGGSCFPAK
ncbi:MAG: SPOR domain-containing protein [Rhizomicrobium sp.]